MKDDSVLTSFKIDSCFCITKDVVCQILTNHFIFLKTSLQRKNIKNIKSKVGRQFE